MLYLFFIIFSIPLSVHSQSESLTFTSSNLPIVVINTNGQSIPNSHKIEVDMGIIYNGPGIRNYITDPFNHYNGIIGIEIRGSTSQLFPKKSYALETRDSSGNNLNVSLFGMPQENDWILSASYNDKSLMRDVLAYKIAAKTGRYASRTQYCEVVLNGDYRGVYILMEKIKRDKNRVDIKSLTPSDTTGNALTGGYIIKIDKTDGENNEGWYSPFPPVPFSGKRVFYQYHYPRPSEITLQQKNYIKNLVLEFETLMYSTTFNDSVNGYRSFIKDFSLADFFLVNEFTKNVDAYRLSTYIHKDRDDIDPRFVMGPVWDFNIAFGNADYYEGGSFQGWQLDFLTTNQHFLQTDNFPVPFWWKKLKEDPHFSQLLVQRWTDLKDSLFTPSFLFSVIDSMKNYLNESQIRNFQRWPILGQYVWPNAYVGQTYQDEINYLKNWITQRYGWIDINISNLVSGLQEEFSVHNKEFELLQNYPNPFNPSTIIRYRIGNNLKSPEPQHVLIKVFDVLGREVTTLVNEEKSPGTYEVLFNPDSWGRTAGLPGGVYFYRLQSGSYSETKKMLLLH